MDTFPFDDLDKTIDENTRVIMLDLIMSWARYDALVSQWLVMVYGMAPDTGSILLGNMDTRTKLERIKALYQHYEMEVAVERVAALQKGHLDHVDVRNSIAHSHCAGRRKSDPGYVVFAPFKAVKGSRNVLLIVQHHLDRMKASAEFAIEAGDKLITITDRLGDRRSEQPLEPPEFLPASRPNPRGRRRGTRQRPRQEKRGRSRES